MHGYIHRYISMKNLWIWIWILIWVWNFISTYLPKYKIVSISAIVSYDLVYRKSCHRWIVLTNTNTGWATKTVALRKLVTRVYCVDTERWSIIKLSSTLSAIRLSWILSQLNVLCTSLVIQYYTRTMQPAFALHTMRPVYVFSDVLGDIEAELSAYQNVSFFIRSV